MTHRAWRVATAFLVLALSPAADAGPYAKQAQQVLAKGGVVQVVIDTQFARRSPAEIEAVALHLCRVIAREGVAVTAVRIVTENEQVIRLVGRDKLVGC